MSAELEPEKKAQELKELLEDLPDEVLEALKVGLLEEDTEDGGKFSLISHRVARFAGPLPPPGVLKEYDSVQPGFAERIVAMAEREQSHRHGLEKRGLSGAINAERFGQVFAFLLSLLLIGGSIYLIATGNATSGTLLGGSTIIGLAYVFITGRKPQSKKGSDDSDSATESGKNLTPHDS
jgi:uncharacterized membrane protein